MTNGLVLKTWAFNSERAKLKVLVWSITFLFSDVSIAQNKCFEHCIEDYVNSTVPFPERNEHALDRLIGCEVPDFQVKTIRGEYLNLSDLCGKIVVINFWHASCEPCVAEIPGLNRLVDEYEEKDVVFMAFTRDDVHTTVKFLIRKRFKYKIVSGDYDISEKYCSIIGGWPVNMVIDRYGVLRGLTYGASPDKRAEVEIVAKIKPIIEACLAQ